MATDAFANLNGFTTDSEVAPVAPMKETEESAASNELVKAAKEELKGLLKDAQYIEVRNSRSNDIEVVKTLGYVDGKGEGKGLVDNTQEAIEKAVAKKLVTILAADDERSGEVHIGESGLPEGTVKLAEGDTKKKYQVPTNLDSKLDTKGQHKPYRRVVTESMIVGYKIKNVSDTPIEYETEVCHKEGDAFVGQTIVAQIKPGETVNITRMYLAKLGAKVEFNMTFKNGILKGKLTKVANDIEAALSSQYFSFNKSEGLEVHAPEVKIQIGEAVTVNGAKAYVIKPEFEEVFGLLNNAKAPKTRDRSKDASANNGPVPTPQELSALILRAKLGM